MAYHTVEDGPWPYGVTVAVWPASSVVGGVPTGAPVDTAVASADGTVTFGGLGEGTDYVAFGSGGSQAFQATNEETRMAAFAAQLAAFTVPDGTITTSKIADGSVTSAKIFDGTIATADIANNAVSADKLSPTAAQQAGVSQAGSPRCGTTLVSASEGTGSATYVKLASADEVTGIVLPSGGLIAVMYRAIWQGTVGAGARAAIFVGTNQLKVSSPTGAPVVQEASSSATVNDDELLGTTGSGLTTATGVGNAGNPVTTGMVSGITAGGPCYIEADAGTYDISVQFKLVGGNVTVKQRRLWVWTIGF